MKKLRRYIEKYERAMLIVVVIIVLVIFTVTKEILDVFRPTPEGAYSPGDVAGSFRVLPGEKTEVTWREFGRGDEEWSWYVFLETGQQPERRRTLDVWRHILLRTAAEREGITIGDADVVEYLRSRMPSWTADPQLYKMRVNQYFRISVANFESAVRGALLAERMREVYRVSFEKAPPEPREKVVEQYAGLNVEDVRFSAVAYPASIELDAARAELQAAEDAEKRLQEFYENDPLVTAELVRFRKPALYSLELLYVPFVRMKTEEDYQKIEDLFFKAFPELASKKEHLDDPSKKEPEDPYNYYNSYHERLLSMYKEQWAAREEQIKGEVTDPEKLKQALDDGGFAIVKERIQQELRVRNMLWYIRDEAAKDPSRSLSRFFGLLQQADDPENPIVSTEPDKGLIVYRTFDHPLTGDELADIEDGGVKFTHNFRNRVNRLGTEGLPKISEKADIYGEQGDGRIVFRLIDVQGERRKTFEELTDGEKTELRDEFYIPEQARVRARKRMEELRTRLVEEKADAQAFQAAVAALDPEGRARFIDNEWIEASYESWARPDRLQYWRDAYEHMRDRFFLHTELAGILSRDRAEKKLGAGSYLDVRVHQRSEADDPGAAYLVLLHERRSPTAETMPQEQYDRYLSQARMARITTERSRWTQSPKAFLSSFGFEFSPEMQKRVDEELAAAEEARNAAAQ